MLKFFLVIALVGACVASPTDTSRNPKAVTIISRATWGARPPTSTTAMSTPVNYVVIHHAETAACTTQTACSASMRSMQNYHMDSNGWADIGYSFGVGGDSQAYEGRGWARVGAHAPGYNDRSIGICAIGSFQNSVPPSGQLTAIKELIAYGVSIGRITSNYRLIGHRQAISTDCPGNAFYNEIRTWDHWVANPTYEDLIEGKYVEDENMTY